MGGTHSSNVTSPRGQHRMVITSPFPSRIPPGHHPIARVAHDGNMRQSGAQGGLSSLPPPSYEESTCDFRAPSQPAGSCRRPFPTHEGRECTRYPHSSHNAPSHSISGPQPARSVPPFSTTPVGVLPSRPAPSRPAPGYPVPSTSSQTSSDLAAKFSTLTLSPPQSSAAMSATPASLSGFKGLSNDAGLHHCYINVGIQLLWHLTEFREPFFAMARWHVCDGYAPSASLGSASSGVAPPTPPSSLISGNRCEGGEDNSGAPSSAQRCVFCALQWLFSNLSFSEAAVIRVDAVRRALSGLDPGLFRWGALGDAEEALQAVLEGVHEFSISASLARAGARTRRASLSQDAFLFPLPTALSHLVPPPMPPQVPGPALADVLDLGLTPRSADACERSANERSVYERTQFDQSRTVCDKARVQRSVPPVEPSIPLRLPPTRDDEHSLLNLAMISPEVLANASSAASQGTGPSCPSHSVFGLGWRDKLVCSAGCSQSHIGDHAAHVPWDSQGLHEDTLPSSTNQGQTGSCCGTQAENATNKSGSGFGLRVYAESLLTASHATKVEVDALSAAVEEIRDGLLAEDRRSPPQRFHVPQHLPDHDRFISSFPGTQSQPISRHQQEATTPPPASSPDSARLPEAVTQVLGAKAGRTFEAFRSQSAFFAEVLRRAILEDAQLGVGQQCRGCGADMEASKTISAPPPALFVPVAWPAEPSPMDKLSDFFGLLPCWFDLSRAASLSPPLPDTDYDHCPFTSAHPKNASAKYALTALICYFGLHYVAFVRDREGDSAWVQLNDRAVRAVGSWRALVDLCMRGHYQPTVLCFTRIGEGSLAPDPMLGKDR